MRRAARLLPLLPLLAGCVDFVDPAGLRLQRDTRVQVEFELVTNPFRAGCSGAVPATGDAAVLCLRASVDPGFTSLGERLRVLDDTLRAMGVALSPAVDDEGVLRYEGRFVLPRATLEEIPITATLPRVEGAEVVPPEIRWFAAGPADPDTVWRAPGEGVRFRVDLPRAASLPEPRERFWSMDVTGDTARATFNASANASGFPLSVYEFPAEVLAALGGSRFRAELRWFRSFSSSAGDLQLIVRLNQWIDWTVLTEEEEAAPGEGASPTGSANGL